MQRSNSFKSFKYRTEHLLLGLMKEPEGIAKVLESFNITEDKVIEEVEKLIGHGQDHVGTLHYTPRAKSH